MRLRRWPLQRAARALTAGGIIACPTEAVWGLSCDPANPDALERLLRLKRRPMEKGLILVAASLVQLEPWLAPLDDPLRQRVEATWPGPNTWLLPTADGVSPLLRGAHSTLAVRVTAHPLVAALCREFGGALVSTSANPAGAPPARSATRVRGYFGSTLDYLLCGSLGGERRPSTIRDGSSGEVVRL